jgi:hypothetical protein
VDEEAVLDEAAHARWKTEQVEVGRKEVPFGGDSFCSVSDVVWTRSVRLILIDDNPDGYYS